jgi:hypothetical protein
LSPRGEFCSLWVKLSPGVIFSVCPSIILNSREYSPLGVKEGVHILPREKMSPLGARGNIRNGPLVSLLNLCSPLGSTLRTLEVELVPYG